MIIDKKFLRGIVFTLVLTLVFFTGCASDAKTDNDSDVSVITYDNDEEDYATAEMIEIQTKLNESPNISGMGDSVVDPRNEDEFFEFVDIVVTGKFIKSAEVVPGAFPGMVSTVYTFKVDSAYKGQFTRNEQIQVIVPGGAIKRKDYIELWDDETASEYHIFETKEGEDIRDFNENEMLYFNMGNHIEFKNGSEYVLYLHGPYNFDDVYSGRNVKNINGYENCYSASILEASGVRKIENAMVQYEYVNEDGVVENEYSIEEIGK